MANVNSRQALYNLPANFASATETAVAALANSIGNNESTSIRAILSPGNDVAGGWVDGHPFKLRACVKATASGAGNLAVGIRWNSGANTDLLTFTGDNSIIASGNLALASKPASMFMECVCLWDSVSQQLAGFWNETAGFANLVTTPAIIKSTAAVASTNPITTALVNASSLQFFVTTSISANGTACELVEFSLEQI